MRGGNERGRNWAQGMGYGDRLIAVVGLAFEARIAAGPGVRVICSGNGKDLAASLSRAILEGAEGVISFGVAGGLSPALAPGTCVIGSAVLYETDRINRINTHDNWSKNLLQTIPGAVRGMLFGVPGPAQVTGVRACRDASQRDHRHRRDGVVDVEAAGRFSRRGAYRARRPCGTCHAGARPAIAGPGPRRVGFSRGLNQRPGRSITHRT